MAAKFTWDYPGLNKQEFVALANLLSLRNSGQVEPSSTVEGIDQDEYLLQRDETESIDTTRPQQVSDFDNDKLKKRFLDVMAEFASKEEGGPFVTCTTMREHEEESVIYLARNNRFEDSDRDFFLKFGSLLSEWSRLSALSKGERLPKPFISLPTEWFDPPFEPQTNALATHAEKIWCSMLSYQGTKIQKTYLPRLKHSLKSCNEHFLVSMDTAVLEAGLQFNEFRDRVLNKKGHQLTLTGYGKLITEAYDMWRTRDKERADYLLNDHSEAFKGNRKLWENIYYFGRLRGAFETIKESLATISSFFRIKFTLVETPNPSKTRMLNYLGLEETFVLLGLPLDSATIRQVLSSNWTVKGARDKLIKLRDCEPQIHAEVKLVLRLSEVKETLDGVFNYMGCSKKSCFMCWNFLRGFGTFTTRGCHGQIYHPWTVPPRANLRQDYEVTIAKALIYVQDKLSGKLQQETRQVLQKDKTSVIGGSSVGGEIPPAEMMQALRQKQVQNRVAFEFSRPLNATATSIASPYWPQDEFANLNRPVTTADILYADCREDKMPVDPKVLDDFCFSKLPSFTEKSRLLGLYQGLQMSNVPVLDLDRWQREGVLVENIKREFRELPEDTRGGYFPWFLKNTHIFDTSGEPGPLLPEAYKPYLDKARSYLSIEDQQQDLKDLQPQAKLESFELLLATMFGAHPNPNQESWVAFGFCACQTESEESILGGKFIRLLNHSVRGAIECPFDRFWRAHHAGRLTSLMDSYNLEIDPKVKRFWSSPEERIYSVWILKQFLAMDQPVELRQFRSIYSDYGFNNCKDFEETCTLMEIYKRLLLDAGPLELHQACIKGRLFEFAKSFHEMKPEYERLMKNIYPLKCY